MPTKLKAGVVVAIGIHRLERDPKQPRQTFDQETLRSLAASLKVKQEQPLKVRQEGNKLIIVDGERRWRAAKIGKIEKLDVLLDERSDSLDIAAAQLTTSVQREELNALDIAEFLVDLQKRTKATTNDLLAALAKRGISEVGPAKLVQMMRLVELPDWAKEYMRKGVLREAHGQELLEAVKFPAVLSQLKKEIAQQLQWKDGITVKETAQEVAQSFRIVGTDLNQRYGEEKDQRHFPIEQCLKCEFYKKIGGAQYCLNRKLFDKKNQEAMLLEAEKAAKKAEREKNGKKAPADDEAGPETDPTKVEPRKVKFVDANCVSAKGLRYDQHRDLEHAEFDKTQCATCPHRHLVSVNGKIDHPEGVEEHCFYRPCYDEKSRLDSRVQSRKGKMREYLEAWLRPVVVREAPKRVDQEQMAGIVLWLATGCVDQGSAFYGGQMHEQGARATVAFLQQHKLKTLPALMDFATTQFKTVRGGEPHFRKLVQLSVQVMTREQLRWFANYLKIDLNDPAFAYRIDEGYLRLKRKAEIIQLWNESPMSTKLEPNLSTEQLRNWCLEKNAREKIGVPKDIQALYAEAESSRDVDDEDLIGEDEQTTCIGCGCIDLEACPGGCSWVVQMQERGYMAESVGVCSNPKCAPHMERWRRRDFELSPEAKAAVEARKKRRDSEDDELAAAGDDLQEAVAGKSKVRKGRGIVQV